VSDEAREGVPRDQDAVGGPDLVVRSETGAGAQHDRDGGSGPDLVVDALGRHCPLPIIDLAKRFGEVPVGGMVELLADDPAAPADVAAWCRLRTQELLGARDLPTGTGQAFLIRRTH
jgi:TusA-related sulfurtransferase